MKNLKLNLGSTFSEELTEEMNQLTMAGRWWLAYQLSRPLAMFTCRRSKEVFCRR
jgi:hypothetical protein